MDRPSPKTLVLIQTDPMKSHRAVEALRIALGLGSHNEGRDISVVLCGRAPYLLSEDAGDIVDGEILEKHIPVFIEWGTPFFITMDSETPHHYIRRRDEAYQRGRNSQCIGISRPGSRLLIGMCR